MENKVIRTLINKIYNRIFSQTELFYYHKNEDLPLKKDRLLALRFEILELKTYLELLNHELDKIDYNE